MQAAAGSRRTFWAYVLLLLIQRFMVTITFYSIISSLFLQARGLDYTLIFSLESWLAVSLLLLEVPSGIWADRFDRKRTLFVGMLLHVAATYVFAFAHSYGLFVLSFLLSGLGMAILSGTDSAYVYDLLKGLGREEESTRLFGWLSATEKAATLLALPVGSRLATFGLEWPVYTTAVVNTLGLLLWLAMPPQRVRTDADTQSQGFMAWNWRMIGRSAKRILTTPILVFIALTGPTVWVIVNAFHYLNQPLFLRAHLPVEAFGWIMGVGMAISLVASILATRVQERLGTLLPIVLSSLLMGLAYLGLALTDNRIVITLLIGLLFGSLSLRTPIMETAVNALIPSEIRATTLSILGMMGTLLTVALNPVIGYLADRSLTIALLFCGITILGLTFVSLPAMRRVLRRSDRGASVA